MEFMMECRGIIHVVREGDTLYTLSQKYHVPLLQVMYANPFRQQHESREQARQTALIITF